MTYRAKLSQIDQAQIRSFSKTFGKAKTVYFELTEAGKKWLESEV